MSVFTRLDKKLEKSGECWVFTGARNPGGYGVFSYKGQGRLARRVMFELTEGRSPEGYVMHSCDNPPCCNPEHLFEGTQKDNLKGMRQRGRSLTGERNSNAKLTWQAVRHIRKSILPVKDLAEIFEVTPRNIRSILDNQSWVE